MTILRNILQESKDNKRIIGIRVYRDDEKFWCGYISDFNETLIQIQHFSESGQPDGIIIEKIENIESIDSEDKYSTAFQYLIENYEKINQIEPIQIELPNSENWQYEFLKKTEKTDNILTMEFEGDFTIYGKINNLDSENAKIEAIGNIGDVDGYSTYRLKDIKAIRINNVESIKRMILLEWRKDKNANG